MLTRILQTGVRRDVMPCRVYRCEFCGRWHLTHVRVGWEDDRMERKSRLRSGKPPERRSGLQRSGRIKPRSEARKAAAAERAKIWGQVALRDNFSCRIAPLVPDVACFGRLTPHHLRKASQGGEFTPDNLIAACQFHNDWVETEPARARALGLVR